MTIWRRSRKAITAAGAICSNHASVTRRLLRLDLKEGRSLNLARTAFLSLIAEADGFDRDQQDAGSGRAVSYVMTCTEHDLRDPRSDAYIHAGLRARISTSR